MPLICKINYAFPIKTFICYRLSPFFLLLFLPKQKKFRFSFLDFYEMLVGANLKFSNKFHHITTLMGNVKCRSNLLIAKTYYVDYIT